MADGTLETSLRTAVIDGVSITDATVKLNGDTTGVVATTILQYPYIDEALWEHCQQLKATSSTV